MDWNQDPHLQRLEEKLDRVLEHLERESKTTHSIPKLFPLKNAKRFFNAQTEHSVITSLNLTIQTSYLKLGHMQSRDLYYKAQDGDDVTHD